MRELLIAVTILASLGCGDEPTTTQTVIRFAAAPEFVVPAGTRIRAVVYGDGIRQHEVGSVLSDAPFVPDTQLVVDARDNDHERRFTVFAELVDADDIRLSWARVRTGFVEDQLSEVRIAFAEGCPAPSDRTEQAADYEGIVICGSHDTCVDPVEGGGSGCGGACVDPEPFRAVLQEEPTARVACPVRDCAEVDDVGLGWLSTCARTGDEMFCWGQISFRSRDDGQLARPSRILNESGFAIPDAAYADAVTVVRHTCVLRQDGSIRCGGHNQNQGVGESRTGNGEDSSYGQCCTITPTPEPPPLRVIAADSSWTCGLAIDDGALWCTGNDPPGTDNGSLIFEPRQPGEVDFDDVFLGRDFYCLTRDGILTCFGGEPSNPLPDGAPIDVAGARSIESGVRALCLVAADGELRCYGVDVHRSEYATNPALLGLGWQSVAVPKHDNDEDISHRCAIREEGSLWCWGDNGDGTSNGAVGIDPASTGFVDEATPSQVGALTDWTKVGVGWRHTCAIRGTGELFCWGVDNVGQLGVFGAGGFEPERVCIPSW